MNERAQAFRFSSAALPRSDRTRALLALRERDLLPIEPLAGRDLHLDIVKWQLPDLKILSGTLAGVSQHSTLEQTRGELLLGLNVSGETAVRHDRREVMT